MSSNIITHPHILSSTSASLSFLSAIHYFILFLCIPINILMRLARCNSGFDQIFEISSGLLLKISSGFCYWDPFCLRPFLWKTGYSHDLQRVVVHRHSWQPLNNRGFFHTRKENFLLFPSFLLYFRNVICFNYTSCISGQTFQEYCHQSLSPS